MMVPMPAVLDHLVVAVPDLDAAVLDFHRATGVQPVVGGSHPGRGTRNALVGLSWRGNSRRYLELLGPDPAQPDVPPEDFMLDVGQVLKGPAGLHAWAVRVEEEDLDAYLRRGRRAGLDMGEVVDASRRTESGSQLRWRMAAPTPLGLGGVQPFVLDWMGGPHPSDTIRPTLELTSFALQHPEPERAVELLAILGVDLAVGKGEDRPFLHATLDTPDGEVVL